MADLNFGIPIVDDRLLQRSVARTLGIDILGGLFGVLVWIFGLDTMLTVPCRHVGSIIVTKRVGKQLRHAAYKPGRILPHDA